MSSATSSVFDAQFVDNGMKITKASTAAEIKALYDQWAASYEEDLDCHGYVVCQHAAEGVTRAVEELSKSKDMRILDVGAGTGMLGSLLRCHGFTNMDAFDMSEEMLKVASSKGVYRETICGMVGDGHVFNADADSYDMITCIGSLTIGHIKPDGLEEFIRVVKPGGILYFSIKTMLIARNEGGFGEAIQRLVEQGQMEVVSRQETDYFTAVVTNENMRRCYLYTCRVTK